MSIPNIVLTTQIIRFGPLKFHGEGTRLFLCILNCTIEYMCVTSSLFSCATASGPGTDLHTGPGPEGALYRRGEISVGGTVYHRAVPHGTGYEGRFDIGTLLLHYTHTLLNREIG